MCKQQTINLYKKIHSKIPLLEGAIKQSNNNILIKVNRSFTDLNRYKDMKQQNQFLYQVENRTLMPLGIKPVSQDSNVLFESEKNNMIFRVVQEEKDIWFEVFRYNQFQFSKKVSEKIKAVYSDTVFGQPRWNQQENKIVFIGEPKDQTFESYFEVKKEDGNKEKTENKQKGQEEKFLYQENFGETLSKKQKPNLYVFDLELQEIIHIEIKQGCFPMNPIFDESGNGLVLTLLNYPNKVLGLNFCLNHSSDLVYFSNYKQNDYEQLSKDFIAIHPQFSQDYKKLLYISNDKFISHSGNYKLTSMNWEDKQSQDVIEKFKEFPTDDYDFCGLFGYNFDYQNVGFISNRFYLFTSVYKGQGRIFAIDLQNNEIKYLDFLEKQLNGNYSLVHQHKEFILFQFSSFNQPNQMYFVHLNKDAQDLNQLILNLQKLDEVELEEEIQQKVKQFKKKQFYLENGSQGNLYLPDDKQKYPLIVLIHGGPFGHYPQDIFSKIHLQYLLKGQAILIINYRGSTGFGENFLNSILGNIGVNDVQDVGELTKKACEFENVDEKRIGVTGGSHGGFLSAWMIGHKDYKSLYKVASLWNPVLNISFMVQQTDIPDWIFSCCSNKEFSYYYDSKDNQDVIQNVSCPTQLLIGSHDLRVPPQQAYYYYHTLKNNNMYLYPESGHSLDKKEHMLDAYLNISLWMDQHL